MPHGRSRLAGNGLVVLLLVGLTGPGPAEAAVAQWSTNGPVLASTVSLAVDPGIHTTVYAGTGGGVFKSTDGGAHWGSSGVGLADLSVSALAVDPQNPTTLYAATSSAGVFKSSDGGTLWNASSEGLTDLSVSALIVDPKSPTTLYAGMGNGGVFKSSDGAAHWSASGAGLGPSPVAVLAMDPQTPTTLYAGMLYGGGVFKSTNGGVDWIAINDGLPDPAEASVRAFIVDPQTPSTLYAGVGGDVFKSSDGGAHWSVSYGGLPDSLVFSLALDPQNLKTVYAGVWNGGVLLKSTDGGGHWNASAAGITDLGVTALAEDPQVPGTIYAGSFGAGLFKSIDGGAHWNASNLGLGANPSILALALDPQAPSTVYAGSLGGAGVFKSVDGGGQWGRRDIGLVPPNDRVFGLAVDPQNPATVYASTDFAVFKSTDGGANWATSSAGLTSGFFSALAVDPQNPAAIYVASEGGGVFKSTDGGGQWSPSGAGLSDPFVGALAVDPHTPATLYAGTFGGVLLNIGEATVLAGGLFKSTDGGAHWNESNLGLPTVFILPYGPFAPTVNAIAIDPQIPAILYAGTDGYGVFRSTDGGAHWSAVNSGLPEFPVRALAVDPQTPTIVYAGTHGGGVFRSTDRGDSWMPFNAGLTDLSINALQVSPSGACVHAATEAGVFDFATRPEPCAAPGPLLAAVLPSSRSVQVGSPATAFVTVINAGAANAAAVGISLRDPVPATLTFWTTDPKTNAVTGAPSAPVDIAAGQSQTYLIALTPTTPFDATEVTFYFGASNTPPAASAVGLNTLLLSASATATPDIVALAATLKNDGIVDISGVGGAGAFAVAAVNVGAGGQITVSADTGNAHLPVTIALCQTAPATGQCISAIGASVTTEIDAGQTPSLGLFVTGTDTVVFDPAINRIFVRFRDAAGVTRGSTSVAVRTQ